MRRNEEDSRDPGQAGEVGTARGDRAAAPKFFVAIFRSKLGSARIYRVYGDAEGLSFLGLGPPHPWIDVAWARKLDDTHWAVRSAQMIRKGVALGVAAGAAVAGSLGWALRRAMFNDPSNAGDLIIFVLTLAGIVIPIGLLLLTGTIRLFTWRVAHLDSLGPEQLRDETERSGWFSFRAAASELSDVSIDPVDKKGDKKTPAAFLSFTHPPTGEWKMELPASKDVKAAARTLVQVLGFGRVKVNVPLKVG